MQPRHFFWGSVLAVSGLLVAGCAGVPAPLAAGPTAEGQASLAERPLPEREAAQLARAHAHYATAVIHEINEELEPALLEYYEAAKLDADNEPLTLDVSRRLLQNKQPQKALDLLKQGAARPNASGTLLALLGMVYSQLGHYEEGATAARLAIKKSPRALAGYQNLFANELQNKKPREAVQALDEAAQQAGVDAEFLIGLSGLYVNAGLQAPPQREATRAKALAVLRRAEQLHPAEAQLRMRLADGLNLLGDSAGAAQLYLELLKSLPDSPVLRERMHAKLMEIYLRSSDHARAVEQLEAILRDDPTNPQACYYLGSIAFADKKPAEAADYFRKTIVLSPEFEPVYYDMASAQINLNQAREALATLQKAREKFSQNFLLEYLSAVAFSREKNYAEAVTHFTAAEVIASARDPKRLDQFFYFQVGAACERAGDLGQAERYFDKCLELAPDFAEALNYVGYMWAEKGEKLEEARERIQKAVKLEPKNGAYLDSLGWVHFKLNEPQAALERLLEAVRLLEEPDATVYDHLGDVYAALNQLEKAREAWRKSLEVEPSEAVRRKLETAGDK
jgi:tetratricopeptide (TPR) repeat protein